MGERGSQGVGPEGVPSFPGASIDAKAALEEGHRRFDAGTETFEGAIDPIAASHLADRQPALLVEGDIVDLKLVLERFEIGLGGEPTVEADLPRQGSKGRLQTFDRLDCELRVGWVSAQHLNIQNEARLACCEAQLMAIVGFTSVFSKNIGVGLEDGSGSRSERLRRCEVRSRRVRA